MLIFTPLFSFFYLLLVFVSQSTNLLLLSFYESKSAFILLLSVYQLKSKIKIQYQSFNLKNNVGAASDCGRLVAVERDVCRAAHGADLRFDFGFSDALSAQVISKITKPGGEAARQAAKVRKLTLLFFVENYNCRRTKIHRRKR